MRFGNRYPWIVKDIKAREFLNLKMIPSQRILIRFMLKIQKQIMPAKDIFFSSLEMIKSYGQLFFLSLKSVSFCTIKNGNGTPCVFGKNNGKPYILGLI